MPMSPSSVSMAISMQSSCSCSLYNIDEDGAQPKDRSTPGSRAGVGLSALGRRHLSLSGHLITHELHKSRRTPYSEAEESLVLETAQYVRQMEERREIIHRTLIRNSHPGEKLRRLLSNRLEKRLVRALTKKKSRRSRRKRSLLNSESRGSIRDSLNHSLLASRRKHSRLTSPFPPSQLSRLKERRPFANRVWAMLRRVKVWPNRHQTGATYYTYGDDGVYGVHRGAVDAADTPLGDSERATPNLVLVDRDGKFRWPPRAPDFDKAVNKEKKAGDANFTLKSPDPSDPKLSPRWLQVNQDDPTPETFPPNHNSSTTDAHKDKNCANSGHEPDPPENGEESGGDASPDRGPFRKVPFHPHLHVLKTKF